MPARGLFPQFVAGRGKVWAVFRRACGLLLCCSGVSIVPSARIRHEMPSAPGARLEVIVGKPVHANATQYADSPLGDTLLLQSDHDQQLDQREARLAASTS